jgi:hypothetical protein
MSVLLLVFHHNTVLFHYPLGLKFGHLTRVVTLLELNSLIFLIYNLLKNL